MELHGIVQNGVIVLNTAKKYAIRRNSIFSNSALGIDLGGDGVSPNDPGDADGGANNKFLKDHNMRSMKPIKPISEQNRAIQPSRRIHV